ncbi:MAG: bifunctional glutamate N-acetyltransferase/amino-acid acetyltransferase ArgJ [Alphaproteobacteria bacterium]|nr:bifunctional glutamate N-acetyltransferase/amino-acid acetyltransferase ArgJ [Alphaproteobacteria bacterium]
MNTVSPLAPVRFPDIPAIGGVRTATVEAGIRYKGRDDLLLVELAPGTAIAGTLTRSLTASAPVEQCREALAGGRARAIVVNSGNSNAFTGRLGTAAVEHTVAAAAQALGCARGEVFVSSTGVIGEPLPAESTIVQKLPGLVQALAPGAWPAAARAIMTTDTFPKGASATAKIDGRTVHIAGIAKGSGMIAPDMATMLAYVFTDAAVPPALLQRLTSRAVERSFNAITVDSDTSTSDTVLVAATGAAGNPEPDAAMLRGFARALEAVCRDLAHQIVRDGEGASKFVEIAVTGAASARAAKRIGLAIANSPLVKTAIAGEDANWGRIVMAVGKAGEKADRDALRIAIGGVEITRGGQVVQDYDETPVARHMQGQDIGIAVDVGVGRGKATVWTCDLTHGYIDINGSYRS